MKDYKWTDAEDHHEGRAAALNHQVPNINIYLSIFRMSRKNLLENMSLWWTIVQLSAHWLLSLQGTVIRVFSIPEGQRLFEFRRGMKRLEFILDPRCNIRIYSVQCISTANNINITKEPRSTRLLIGKVNHVFACFCVCVCVCMQVRQYKLFILQPRGPVPLCIQQHRDGAYL